MSAAPDTHPSQSQAVTDLLAANAHYVEEDFPGPLPMNPARRMIVLACVDPRVDPALVLGLRQGEAAVVRNIGGRVTPDLLRSMQLLQTIARPSVGESAPVGSWTFVVLQHTDCGITRLADRPDLLGPYLGLPEEQILPADVTNPHHAVTTDVARLSATLGAQFTVVGLVHDLQTGAVAVSG